MAKVYAMAILRGDRKLSTVPKVYQVAVKKILQDFVTEGTISKDDYNKFIKE